MTSHHVFETAAGFAAIGWNASGICSFRLPAASSASAERALLKRFPGSTRTAPPAEIAAIVALACRYFAGEQVDFSAAPVDIGEQEPFFARVYAHVRGIGWGETTTYGTVAKALGEGPEAARAVGQAMANNPVPLIVPCHRVLAAGGKIGGFSAPGGSNSKAHMLELEGVATAPPQMGFGF
ncbi:methylated-DNA--[protein]-cysteine S-methyltransferase [Novosphingobium sp. G106]|uniref:methylated-DNA--[protein]-cysteine S-methyltransferase n=1 Tax=Novosphingobium sp. G106 TaxID=2849500 RepID=UPI001C2D9DA7|nr:methylated-DNA--[protein]-cysteine S-methyltransferase [Novosphingobium sp. G106]MBV1688838.1 methylated-DNA--[protein]-cysteine S-methyltransferase [Novosphingobium sp. G106]